MRRLLASRFLKISAAVLCLISLAANCVLAMVLRQAFVELQYSRIFPLGRSPGSTISAPSANPVPIAIYGDSRAHLWNTSALSDRFGIVRNFAQGGITSSQLLLQLQSEPVTRSEWAIVQIGINDIHPLGAMPNHKTEVLANLQRNLVSIVGLLLARSDYVVVSTIVPPGRVPLQRRLLWDPQSQSYIAATNEMLRKLPRETPRVLLLDASMLLAGDTGSLQSRYTDPDFFLHITSAGYDVLNQQLFLIISRTGDLSD